MGFNWSGIVVPSPDDDSLGRIKGLDSDAIPLPGGYARVSWDRGLDWSRSGATKRWSLSLGEAWYLEAASVAGVFGYEHGKQGAVLRSLGYYPGEGWVLIEGEPETWESVFFGDRQLRMLHRIAEDEPDDPRWARQIEDVEAKKLRLGNLYPIADAEWVMLIAQQLGTTLLR